MVGSRYVCRGNSFTVHTPLQDHYQLCLNWLTNLLKRKLSLKEYDAVIKNQMCNGIIEQVQEPTVSTSHYLPLADPGGVPGVPEPPEIILKIIYSSLYIGVSSHVNTWLVN